MSKKSAVSCSSRANLVFFHDIGLCDGVNMDDYGARARASFLFLFMYMQCLYGHQTVLMVVSVKRKPFFQCSCDTRGHEKKWVALYTNLHSGSWVVQVITHQLPLLIWRTAQALSLVLPTPEIVQPEVLNVVNAVFVQSTMKVAQAPRSAHCRGGYGRCLLMRFFPMSSRK